MKLHRLSRLDHFSESVVHFVVEAATQVRSSVKFGRPVEAPGLRLNIDWSLCVIASDHTAGSGLPVQQIVRATRAVVDHHTASKGSAPLSACLEGTFLMHLPAIASERLESTQSGRRDEKEP